MGTPLDPKRDHRISLEDAAVLTRRYRQGGKLRSGDSGAFNGPQVEELLKQPGCAGVRVYKGRDAEGMDALILVGVDGNGDDMANGMLLEFDFRCPPFCGDSNALNT